jgi:2-phosphoglycerate kinase
MTEQNLTKETAISALTISESLKEVDNSPSDCQVSAVQRATEMIAAASVQQPLPKYIAIEGAIGVGKTTLAKKIGRRLRLPANARTGDRKSVLGSLLC